MKNKAISSPMCKLTINFAGSAFKQKVNVFYFFSVQYSQYSRYNGNNYETLAGLHHSFLNRSIHIFMDRSQHGNPARLQITQYQFLILHTHTHTHIHTHTHTQNDMRNREIIGHWHIVSIVPKI